MQFASVNWFTFTRDSSKKGEIDYGYDAVEWFKGWKEFSYFLIIK